MVVIILSTLITSLISIINELLKILRHRSRYLRALLIKRMVEFNTVRVQRQMFKTALAVFIIPNDRMPKVCHVNPYLILAAG